jgi:hypothetical protein
MTRAKKSRRAGATQTFSVSVDEETKKALRALADEAYDGNLSALITSFGAEARRRMAAARFLRRRGIAKLTAAEAADLDAEIAKEVAVARRRRRKVA